MLHGKQLTEKQAKNNITNLLTFGGLEKIIYIEQNNKYQQ
jgi:hypothetical protein